MGEFPALLPFLDVDSFILLLILLYLSVKELNLTLSSFSSFKVFFENIHCPDNIKNFPGINIRKPKKENTPGIFWQPVMSKKHVQNSGSNAIARLGIIVLGNSLTSIMLDSIIPIQSMIDNSTKLTK